MRFKTGVVIGTKMAKTVTVQVERLKSHPKYKKQYRVNNKFYAHNEDESIKVGDVVTIMETRPLSKLKRWVVVTEAQKKALTKEARTVSDKKAAIHEIKPKVFTLDYKKRVKKAKPAAEAEKAPEAPAETEVPANS